MAALLDERDILRGEKDANFHLRWLALQHGGAVDRAVRERVKTNQRLREILKNHHDSAQHEDKIGLMLALCYPGGVSRGGVMSAGNAGSWRVERVLCCQSPVCCVKESGLPLPIWTARVAMRAFI